LSNILDTVTPPDRSSQALAGGTAGCALATLAQSAHEAEPSRTVGTFDQATALASVDMSTTQLE
jgi:hypothetical protein